MIGHIRNTGKAANTATKPIMGIMLHNTANAIIIVPKIMTTRHLSVAFGNVRHMVAMLQPSSVPSWISDHLTSNISKAVTTALPTTANTIETTYIVSDMDVLDSSYKVVRVVPKNTLNGRRK